MVRAPVQQVTDRVKGDALNVGPVQDRGRAIWEKGMLWNRHASDRNDVLMSGAIQLHTMHAAPEVCPVYPARNRLHEKKCRACRVCKPLGQYRHSVENSSHVCAVSIGALDFAVERVSPVNPLGKRFALSPTHPQRGKQANTSEAKTRHSNSPLGR